MQPLGEGQGNARPRELSVLSGTLSGILPPTDAHHNQDAHTSLERPLPRVDSRQRPTPPVFAAATRNRASSYDAGTEENEGEGSGTKMASIAL